jgi:hypothetical protein
MTNLDWTILPEELSYLIDPAIKYGCHQFDDAIYEFLENKCTIEDKVELNKIRDRSIGIYPKINSWMDRFPITKHK